MMNGNGKSLKLAVLLGTLLATSALVYYQPDQSKLNDIPNRLPEAAPYVLAEAQAFPPPSHDHWEQEDSPGQCQTCHQKIFDEWNGSMMSNSWRDPVWRAAFLALARATSANGECDTPEPPDGTPRAIHILLPTRVNALLLLILERKNTQFRAQAPCSISFVPAATCPRTT